MNRKLFALVALFTALSGSASAGLKEAQTALEQKDYDSALAEITPLAREGQPDATNLLGRMYQFGWGVPLDVAKARQYYRQGAQVGHIESVNSLRALNNIDFRKEFDKLLPKASQGNPSAQNRIGEMYEFGYGVDRNPANAYDYYRRAAEQGYVGAQHNLARSYNFGTGIEQDFAEAEKWYRVAAKKGYTKSMFFLGTLYSNGHGQDNSTDQDITAYAWMSNAAALGDGTAAAIESRLLMKLDDAQTNTAKALSESYKLQYVTPFQ